MIKVRGAFCAAVASALAQSFAGNTAPLCQALAAAQATAAAAQIGWAQAAADAFAFCS
jgi:hypothetical protein